MNGDLSPKSPKVSGQSAPWSVQAAPTSSTDKVTQDNTYETLQRLASDHYLATHDDWPFYRKWLFIRLHSWSFETFICVQILLNLCLAIYETDCTSLPDVEVPEWVASLNMAMWVSYSFEVSCRLFVFRADFFIGCINWNTFDLTLVLCDLAVLIVTAISGSVNQNVVIRCLRLLRALRVVKAIRTWSIFRELYIMLKSLYGAMKAMFWSTILMALILVVFGIVAVEIVQPLVEDVALDGAYPGCDRCPVAFQTVAASCITMFQQIVAGDSWGLVTIPVMEKYWYTFPFFIAVLVTVQFGILNLVLVVIVDQAHKASEDDALLQASIRRDALQSSRNELIALCEELDTDKSGTIGVQELAQGFREVPQLANQLKFLELSENDVHILFEVLDSDGSGCVAYDEFVEQLFKMQNQDTGVTLSFIKSYVQDVSRKIDAQKETISSISERLEHSGRKSCEQKTSESVAKLENDCLGTSAAANPSNLDIARRLDGLEANVAEILQMLRSSNEIQVPGSARFSRV